MTPQLCNLNKQLPNSGKVFAATKKHSPPRKQFKNKIEEETIIYVIPNASQDSGKQDLETIKDLTEIPELRTPYLEVEINEMA